MNYDFCKFKNAINGSAAELFFYGDIVSDSWSAWKNEDQYPMNVRALLNEIGSNDIDIHINSGGGNVFAGFAICNMLKSCTGYKRVYVDGLAASISSVIAMAGDEIIIPSNAFMMIHKASVGLRGNSDDLRTMADVLDKLDSGIAAVYMAKAAEGVNEDKIIELMTAETWLSGDETAELFSNIKTVEAVEAVASCDSKYMSEYSVPEAYAGLSCRDSGQPGADCAGADDSAEKLAAYIAAVRAGFGIQ